MIEITRARSEDAEDLMSIAKKAFLDDLKLRPRKGRTDGPPGFDDVSEHERWTQNGHYYKAVLDGRLVGGGYIVQKSDDAFSVEVVFVDPDVQGQGIGSKLMETILGNHQPRAKWALYTQSYSPRNHHLYEKYGFVKQSELDGGMGWIEFYYYEKPV